MTPTTREDLTAQQVEVVAIGAPSICDEASCERPLEAHSWWAPVFNSDYQVHPCAAAPGDWVLLAPRSLTATDEDDLYVVHQDDVLAILQP